MSSEENGLSQIQSNIIANNWREMPIGDTCYLIKNSYIPNKNEKRKNIGLEHIGQETLKLIDIGNSQEIKSVKLNFKSGHILFGKLRPYFRKVYMPNFDGVCSTDFFVIQGKKGFDNKYLFYFFANWEIINEATNSSEGTRMPRASWEYLSNLKRKFPPLPEQKAIAKILSDLDEKIELNTEMNKTLEEIGQNLFKRWFIDFEFPDENGNPYSSSGGEMVYSEELGKEIPKGWEVKRLDDLADFLKGKRSPAEFYVDKDHPDAKPYVRIADFGNSYVTVYTKADWCLECLETDTLLATDGSIGLSDFGWKGVLTHHILCIRQKRELIDPYLLFTIIKLNEKYLASCNTASVSPTLRQDYVKSILLPYPPKNTMKKYSGLSEAIRLLIYTNKNENKSLSELRDSLLPKLMSGEIRVPMEAD